MPRGGKRLNAGRPRTIFRVELTPEEAHTLDLYRQSCNDWLAGHGLPALTTAEYLQNTVVQQLRCLTFDPGNTPVDLESEPLP